MMRLLGALGQATGGGRDMGLCWEEKGLGVGRFDRRTGCQTWDETRPTRALGCCRERHFCLLQPPISLAHTLSLFIQ